MNPPEKPAPKTPPPPKPDAEEELKAESLTPEEQMAQYEESLKETDWGHQPC